MPSDEDWAEQSTSAPAASTSPVPEAEPLDASEDPSCPICRAASSREGCGSSCTHCFCPCCIEDWSRSRSFCPRCRQPLHHLFPRQGARCQERHHGPAARRSSGRDERRAARSSYRHPSGQNRSSSHGDGQAGRAEQRGRRRAARWQDEAHRGRTRRGWGHISSRRRRQRRALHAASRAEEDVLASSRRGQRRRRALLGSSRRWHAARSRARRRSRRNRDRAWSRFHSHTRRRAQ